MGSFWTLERWICSVSQGSSHPWNSAVLPVGGPPSSQPSSRPICSGPTSTQPHAHSHPPNSFDGYAYRIRAKDLNQNPRIAA